MDNNFDVQEINFSSLLGIDAHWNVNKALARELGLETAIILSDLISKEDYFKLKGELDEEGYFFNTQSNLEIDLGLSPHKQRNAIELLKEKDLISVKLAGSPARNFYKINKIQLLKFLTTSSQKISQLDVKKFNNLQYNKNKVKRTKNNTGSELKHSLDIPKVIEALAKFVDPKNKDYYGRQDMRKACDFVIEEYGLEKVLKTIEKIPELQMTIPFFPNITDPKELKNNWIKAKNAISRTVVAKINNKQKEEDKKTSVSF